MTWLVNEALTKCFDELLYTFLHKVLQFKEFSLSSTLPQRKNYILICKLHTFYSKNYFKIISFALSKDKMKEMWHGIWCLNKIESHTIANAIPYKVHKRHPLITFTNRRLDENRTNVILRLFSVPDKDASALSAKQGIAGAHKRAGESP
jgi:hypothetical protein